MAFSDTVPWQSFEQWGPTAFIVGGLAWAALIALAAANMTTEAAVPTWSISVFLIVGLLAAYVGLLGFYPQVSPTAPRLSLAGVVATAVAVVILASAIIYTVATSSFTQGPPFPVFPLLILSTILGFLLLGTASLRTSTPTRRIGILLILPAIAWLSDIIFIVTTSTLEVEAVAGIPLIVIPLIGMVIASGAMVGTGYLLHARSDSIDDRRGEASLDTAAR